MKVQTTSQINRERVATLITQEFSIPVFRTLRFRTADQDTVRVDVLEHELVNELADFFSNDANDEFVVGRTEAYAIYLQVA